MNIDYQLKHSKWVFQHSKHRLLVKEKLSGNFHHFGYHHRLERASKALINVPRESIRSFSNFLLASMEK